MKVNKARFYNNKNNNESKEMVKRNKVKNMVLVA